MGTMCVRIFRNSAVSDCCVFTLAVLADQDFRTCHSLRSMHTPLQLTKIFQSTTDPRSGQTPFSLLHCLGVD
eukprot:2913682-Rhodomonas_salina.1